MVVERYALLQSPLALKLSDANIADKPSTFDPSSFLRGGIADIKAVHFTSSVQFVNQDLPRLAEAIDRFRSVQFDTMAAQKIIAWFYAAGTDTDFFVTVETGNRDLSTCSCFGTRRTLPGHMMLWQALDLFLFPTLSAYNHGLQPFLSSNVVLNDLLRHVPSRRAKVAACPERRETTQDRVLLAKMVCCEPLALFDHIGGRICRPYAHKEMNMIGLNRHFQELPTLLSTLLLDKGLAVFGDTAPKHGFAALGTPDQVVDDKVNAVFIFGFRCRSARVCMGEPVVTDLS
jgi:hypothetical protein